MIRPDNIENWINDKHIKDTFTQHFLRTGEMDEQDDITSFRLVNTLRNGILWIEVNTTGWTLDARVLVDENSNFIALA